MNTKYITVLFALLMVGSAFAAAPKKLKDFPSVKLLKGDKFKLDLAKYIEQQNISIEDSTVVKYESRFGTPYRSIPAPQYTYNVTSTNSTQTITMRKCKFGTFSQTGTNNVICGENKSLALWRFQMDDTTNKIKPGNTNLYARFFAKDKAQQDALNIDRCEHSFSDGKGSGNIWVVCYTKGGSQSRGIKIVLVHIASTAGSGTDPYKGVRTVTLDQTNQAYPYFTSGFSVQRVTQTGNSNSVYILRKNRFASDDKTGNRSKARIFSISGESPLTATLTITDDKVVDFKDLALDTQTSTTNKFGTTSEILSIEQRASGSELLFTIKAKDNDQISEFNQLKMFHFTLQKDTSTGWKFAPSDAAALTISSKEFGSFQNVGKVYYQDQSKTDSAQNIDGFYLVNLEKIAYFNYNLVQKKDWNLKKKFEKEIKCVNKLNGEQNYVESITPVTYSSINVNPNKSSLFIKYTDGSTDKKIIGYGQYNLMTNRYSCNTQKKSEIENMVSSQKLVTFETDSIKHYRVADSAYLSIDYSSIPEAKQDNVNHDFSFKVKNKLDADSSSSSSFTIKVTAYKSYTKAKLQQSPVSELQAYESEWVTLPFRRHNLAANNPTISLSVGKSGESSREAVAGKDYKLFYKNDLEFKVKLSDSTTDQSKFIDKDITDMIAVDQNTFVAIQSGQVGSVKNKDKYWIVNCTQQTKLNSGNHTLQMTCTNPPKKLELERTDQYIQAAYKLKNWVILVIKSTSLTNKKTILGAVSTDSVVGTAYTGLSNIPVGFDYMSDGPRGYFAFIGQTASSVSVSSKNNQLKQNLVKSMYVLKIEIGSDSKLKYTLSSGINSSDDICPNSIKFESTSDANQKTRFLIRSQCLGKPSSIQELITNDDYSKIIQVTRKKIIHESGYQICPTKGEVLVFVPRKRRLYAIKLGNQDQYEYPLVESGIEMPLMMNCLSEKNLVQIIGKTSSQSLAVTNFIGGNSQEPASRIHSSYILKNTSKITKVKRISTGFSNDSSRVTTLVSFIPSSLSLENSFVVKPLVSLDLDGPIIQYYAPKNSINLAIGLQTIKDEKLSNDDGAFIVVKNVPLNDVVSMQALKDTEKVQDKIDLEKHVKYSGAVTGGALETTLGKTDIELVSNRKMLTQNEYENSKINIKMMYTLKKWSVFYYTGPNGASPQIDFKYDLAKTEKEGTTAGSISPQPGTFYGFAFTSPPESDSRVLYTVTRYSKTSGTSAKEYGYNIFRVDVIKKNGKDTMNLNNYSDIRIDDINIEDQFQTVLVEDDNLVVCEKRANGEYLNFFLLKKSTSKYALEPKKTKGIGLKFNAVDFTTTYIQNKVVVLFTAVESAQIGYVTYDPSTANITQGWFDATNKNDVKLLPAGIDCKNTPNSTNQLTCFIDTIGPANYEIKYTIDFTKNFIKSQELISGGKFNSPKGFERIKTIQSGDFTAVLYKNNQKEDPKKVTLLTPRLFLKEQLMSGTPIYQCGYILEVYKKPHEYSYITYTCKDFMIAAADTKSVPDFSIYEDKIFISQHYDLSAVSTNNLKAEKQYRIKGYKTGGFEIHVKNKTVDLKQVKFKVYGNNGNESSKTVEELMKADKKSSEESSSFWFWVFIFLAVVLIAVVGFVLFKKMSGGIEEQPGYTKDISNTRPSDMDDTRL